MSRTDINDLPADVLLAIFRILLLRLQKRPLWPTSGWDERKHGEWPPHERSMIEIAFPESIASVCGHWREVMSSVSVFWTRLVIWVGKNPTPLSRVREYLEWSRDHPIYVYILQKPEASADSDLMATKAEVDAQMRAVMETLAPHMARWSLLHIDLHHSSSLPRPRIDLVGHAEKLKTLELTFAVDDSTDDAPPTREEFLTPALKWLSMGGMHFRQSYVEPFPSMSMPTLLRDICISDYGSHHPSFPLVDFLRCLVTCKKLCHVELSGLELDCSYAGPPIDLHVAWSDADFKDMNGDVIAELDRLLHYPYMETRSYTRCEMDKIREVGGSYYIHLDEITGTTALLSLLGAIHNGFSCNEAILTNCDGLRGSGLLMLSGPMPGTDFWWCQHLKSLTIGGCNQFTSADLRTLIEARYTVNAEAGFPGEDDPDFVVKSLDTLHIQDCCELQEADKEWLNGRVESVVWDGWTGGCGISH